MRLLTLFSIMIFGLYGCGGDDAASTAASSGEVLSSSSVGISIPTKLNTIPADNSAAVVSPLKRSLMTALEYATQTDFEKDGDIEVKISEPALDQFGIIEQVLGAFKQTGYADPRAINQGPYQALIKWESDGGGHDVETWTVDSKMIVVSGADVNRVRFWIDEADGDKTQGILDVTTAPSSSNKYGEWSLNVSFTDADGSTGGNFTASSSIEADGSTRLALRETGEGLIGVLVLNNTEGKGVVTYPDYDSCTSWPCTPDSVQAFYSYNSEHMQYKKGDRDPRCKSRSNYADIYADYNIYDANGMNVTKQNSFSFPLNRDNGGNEYWYYYQAWQGRQQLWGENADDANSVLAVGDVLEHGDYGNNSTYTVSQQVTGILSKRAKVAVAAADIADQVLQGQDNNQSSEGFVFGYDSGWKKCNEFDWYATACTTWGDAVNINQASYDSSDTKRVQITEVGDNTWSNILRANATDQTKFYNVWVNYPIFIKYSTANTRWEQYQTVDFSTNPYDPTLSNLAGSAYNFGADTSFLFFWTNQGTSYVFTISGTNPTAIIQEKEETVGPGTVIAGDLTTNGGATTYTWDDSTNMLKLAGSDVTEGVWQLEHAGSGIVYNWSYDSWSKLTYMTYKDNPPTGKTTGETVILDSPLYFDSVVGKDLDDNDVTVNGLAFDGHLFGYTDVWQLLYQSRQDGDSESGLTPEQKSKIVNFPKTAAITSLDGNTTYKIKPRFAFRLLDGVDNGSCTATVDTTLDVTTAPIFALPGTLSAMPTGTVLKVSEGVYLEDKTD